MDQVLNEAHIDISLLLSRLTWPSGMVRERACVAIAELLLDPKWTQPVQKQLLSWMNGQALESVSAIGLLVFLRVKMKNASLVQNPQELSSALHRKSILSHVLLDELGSQGVSYPDWSKLYSATAPKNFIPDPFFSKYSRNFLPPTYDDRAKEIESDTGLPFLRQWAFEWHKIMESLGKKASNEPLDFMGREYSDHYVAFDTEMSEVYRSAYLRTLAWAVVVGVLSKEVARILAIRTCPIDLGLWHFDPSPKPKWWPNIDVVGEEDANIATRFWLQVEESSRTQRLGGNDWITLEAAGLVHEDGDIYDLELFGLFGKDRGSSPPNLNEIVKWCRWENVAEWGPSSIQLNGQVKHISPNSLTKNFNGWQMVPASCRVITSTTPRWHYWRVFRGTWIPAPFLGSDDFSIHCSEEALVVSQKEETIGKWNDWTHRLKEKTIANLPPSTGQVLVARRKEIEAFLKATNSSFSWVCCLTKFHREHDHEPYGRSEDFRQYTIDFADSA